MTDVYDLFSGKEKPLKDYLRQVDPYNINPEEMPAILAASREWQDMDQEQLTKVLGGMARNTLYLALEQVPLYRSDSRWDRNKIKDVITAEDLLEFPVTAKDGPDGSQLVGFRNRALADPHLLVPRNLQILIEQQKRANPGWQKIRRNYFGDRDIHVFGSGGSEGGSTQTHLSFLTMYAEVMALARGLYDCGFLPEMSIACLYNDTHKGGLYLKLAADIMGMDFHSKADIFKYVRKLSIEHDKAVTGFQQALDRKNLETADRLAPLLQEGICKYVKDHKIQVLEAVQPDVQPGAGAKGMGLSAMDLYHKVPSAFDTVTHFFLTGFRVPEFAYTTLREQGKKVRTIWGSTEAMALGVSSGNTNVNDLLALNFPTIGAVAKIKTDLTLEQTVEREQGALLITRFLPGSIYVNYLMDLATNRIGGFKNIHKINGDDGDLSGTCAGDALSIGDAA